MLTNVFKIPVTLQDDYSLLSDAVRLSPSQLFVKYFQLPKIILSEMGYNLPDFSIYPHLLLTPWSRIHPHVKLSPYFRMKNLEEDVVQVFERYTIITLYPGVQILRWILWSV